MNSRKKCIILVSSLSFLLVVVGVIIYIEDVIDTMNVLLINSDGEVVQEGNTIDDAIIAGDTILNNKNGNLNSDDTKTYDDNSINDAFDYTEEDVVEYFSAMDEEVRSSHSFKDKFKKYFIIMVDFIFYDEEINGYTFNELSSTAKVEIIGIALKIDSKIEECLPNYKENISSVGSNIYNDVKEKLVTLYLNISTDICKDNEVGCAKVKENFAEIKEICGVGWDYIKNMAYYGGSKLKEWYDIYVGK